MTATARARTIPKVDGAFISAATHPHVFANNPGLRERTDARGMVLVASAVAAGGKANLSAVGAARQTVPTASAAATAAEAHPDDVSGILANYRMMTGQGRTPEADAYRNMAPAAADRLRGGPPQTDFPADQIDAYFDARSAARGQIEGMADESAPDESEALLARMRAQGLRHVRRRR